MHVGYLILEQNSEKKFMFIIARQNCSLFLPNEVFLNESGL